MLVFAAPQFLANHKEPTNFQRSYIVSSLGPLACAHHLLWHVLPCRRAVAEHKPKIVFLTSPNNPDGSVISEQDLLEVLALPVLVVLDEAYIEFCTDVPSRLKWVQQYNNLVVLRTFSKCAALAGMRVGYGAFPLGMIEYLWRAKQPYNVSVAAEVSRAEGLWVVAHMFRHLLLQSCCAAV